MTLSPSRHGHRRRGAIAAQAALALTALLAMLALGTDYGGLMITRRHAQAVADASAMAAAATMYQNIMNGLAPNDSSSATNRATAIALANGFTSSNSSITPNATDGSGIPQHGVWILPISGPFANK